MSNKETVESWDDVRHAFNDILQRPVQRFLWHRDILPRYIDGSLRLHLHIALEDGVFANCCEVFARDTNGALQLEAIDFGLRELDSQTVNLAHGGQEQTMLVLVYEFGEQANRLIPSVVRLRRFNLTDRACGNLSVRKTIKTVFDFGGCIADREGRQFSVLELGDVKLRDEVSLGKFPRDVIERGPGISSDVSDNTAQRLAGLAGDNRLQDVDRGEPSVLRSHVGLASDFIRVLVEVPLNFRFQGLDVLLCPDDFESCSV